VGQVVDFLGRPYPLQPPQESSSSSSDLDGNSSSASQQQRAPIGADQLLPLLNRQPDMNSREQINQPLMTGVKAFDILTPLGRGQAQQIVGPQGSGKSQLCIDAVIGQRGAGVRCVYAAVGSTHEQLQRTVGLLRQHGCMEYTTVVAATRDR
jgi:F-type H+-transporting ATPase subunit alpha